MNWMRLKPLYFLISGAALVLSLYSIFVWGFKPSIDFTGGTVIEYQFADPTTPEMLRTVLSTKAKEYEVKDIIALTDKNIQLKFAPDFSQEKAEMLSLVMAESFSGKPNVVRFETVGPAFSQEILNKTYTAIGIASIGILLWVAVQFKSIKFGVSAILAMLHDSIILLGTFAILGHYKGVEIDILFVTAMLTVLSFSVHDTIVVYDRIRESTKRFGDIPFLLLANKAVSETMVRSVNNSLTIIFMLFALFLMGGASIKWFVFALLVGTISGTYSSPFVAVPLLVVWEEIRSWWKTRRK